MTGGKHRNGASAVPGWLVGLIVAMLLPLLAWPKIITMLLDGLSQGNDAVASMLFLFPGYALLSAWLAYRCYPRRRELTWILLATLLLAYAAMFFLITHTPQLI